MDSDCLCAQELYSKGNFSQAYPLFIAAASRNDATAMCYIGWMYHSGEVPGPDSSTPDSARSVTSSVDFNEARIWYERASELDHPPALNGLAILYENGDGVEADRERAISLYRRAADGGYISAMYNLGRMHEMQVPKDYVSAVALYTRAVEKSEELQRSGTLDSKQGKAAADAMCKLGYFYEERDGWDGGGAVTPNNELAVEWYRRSSRGNSTDGKYNLACLLEQGIGVEAPMLDEARQLFEELASSGDPESQLRLGAIHERGLGVPKDMDQAARYYQMAADVCMNLEKPTTDAYFDLGLLYKLGRGLEQSDEKAFFWFLKAAERGDAEAEFQVGLCYESGRGPEERDYIKALEYYTRAGEQGQLDAMFNAAVYFEQGTASGEPDGERAIEWYKRAALMGDPGAQTTLGVYHQLGRLVPADMDESKRYLSSAAQQQYAPAAQNLARITGDIERNEKEAMVWWEKAAEWGSYEAMIEAAEWNAAGRGLSSANAIRSVYWYTHAALMLGSSGPIGAFDGIVDKILSTTAALDRSVVAKSDMISDAVWAVLKGQESTTFERRYLLLRMLFTAGASRPRWSTATHGLFLTTTRRCIRVLLMIHQFRYATRRGHKDSRLGLVDLPLEVVFHLFALIGEHSWEKYCDASFEEIKSVWDV